MNRSLERVVVGGLSEKVVKCCPSKPNNSFIKRRRRWGTVFLTVWAAIPDDLPQQNHPALFKWKAVGIPRISTHANDRCGRCGVPRPATDDL